VLVLAAHYLPGYKAGGPIRTISNLVTSLGDDFDFRIFTADHDYGERKPFNGVAVNEWIQTSSALVFYADAAGLRPTRMARTVSSVAPDVVYVNSLFSPAFSIVPLVLRRLGQMAPRASWIVAPRGECSRSAMALKAPKKLAYLAAARLTDLHKGVIFQASSEHEAADIERELRVPRRSIRIAPNVTAPVVPEAPPHTVPLRDPHRLSICFLARICAMKNLAFVIETVRRCACDIDLHIYGPIDDAGYAQTCRQLAPDGDASLTVSWHGEVPHERVRSVLAEHDLFFLPTLGENFGHGIFEALAAGVPVLVSDRTPWRALDEAGVGWVRSLDDGDAFVSVIEGLASMAPQDRLAMRERALAYAAKVAESSESWDANRQLFHDAMLSAGHRRPRHGGQAS
jgi:glycosyltransferase involved in cell wall biosynthesis